jgi:hypothetical protein
MAERSFVSRRKLNQPKIQPHLQNGGGKKSMSIESVLTCIVFTLLENVFL